MENSTSTKRRGWTRETVYNDIAMIVRTPRLELRPATLQLVVAAEADKDRFGTVLGARVPPGWPPEILRKHLPGYYHAVRIWPEWRWRFWYVISRERSGKALCGAVTFTKSAGLPGIAEMGYSLLPEFQGRGLATEMVIRLTAWVKRHGQMRVVLAQVHRHNSASIRVMEKSDFKVIGRGTTPGTLLFCR